MTAAQVQHGVKRHVLFDLPVEQKVARLRQPDIARHAVRVQLLQRLRVGKLRVGAVRQVSGDKRSGAHPEQSRAERSARVGEFLH